jgi:hypothetical protein
VAAAPSTADRRTAALTQVHEVVAPATTTSTSTLRWLLACSALCDTDLTCVIMRDTRRALCIADYAMVSKGWEAAVGWRTACIENRS